MPEELRRRLVEATTHSGRSINAEIVTRLEASLDADDAPDGAHVPTIFRRGTLMHQRRLRRRLLVAGVLVTALAAALAGGFVKGGGGSTAAGSMEGDEVPPLVARKLAAAAQFAPSVAINLLSDNPSGWADEDWLKHASPGNDIPFAFLSESRSDWKAIKTKPARGGAWTPLGPTIGSSPFNPFRDRTVYTSGTENFSGRSTGGAIDPGCNASRCRLWISNANGGVWLTENALDSKPSWEFVSHGFEHQNTATVELDPNDSGANTLWVGTGEPNACGSGCEAGVGLYKSTNGGKAWSGPIGREHFEGRAVGSIAIKPGDSSTIFAASGRAIRGLTSNCCGGADALIPGAPHFGLWRSENGGQTWELVSQGAATLCTNISPDVYSLGGQPCSPRGARRVMFDPVDANTVYASFFARGIWRSSDGGDTWTQIMAPVGPLNNNERAEFDVVELPSGATRMYVGVGGGAGPDGPDAGTAPDPTYARFLRSDSVRTGTPTFVDLTSADVANAAGYSSFGYCDGQCSYDNYVHVPAGADADTVYLSGDNEYNENNFVTGRSNGRGVLLSTNAGVSFTDMTEDTTSNTHPGALHPDHHALVTNPANWQQFFDIGDGGINRSNGAFVDDSGDCASAAALKAYTGDNLAFCQLVLSRVPEQLDAINEGLRTLHFYQLAYNPNAPDEIAGGTQDNGSWETLGDRETWVNTNIADGGHNGFDVADPNYRMTSWQQGQLQSSFSKQNQVDQTWISDTLWVLYPFEAVGFIAPGITDPVQSGWLWTGREHVFRSTNFGINPTFGKAAVLESCNVWTGDFDLDENGTYEPLIDICDDFKPLGDPGPNGRLTAPGYGDRAGGTVAFVERAKSDQSTLWAATSAGRIFISKNADATDPATVTFTRLDALVTNDPGRYPSALYVDPEDANHAWLVYSGFNAKTPTTPGHVFEVRYNPSTNTATFTSLDGEGKKGFGDIPATSVAVSDDGTVYVGTDFGVVANKANDDWKPAGTGMPTMAVPDLILVPQRGVLYAATHGQGVWSLKVK
jgi:hypothetical protein